jgi:hypothetical protein
VRLIVHRLILAALLLSKLLVAEDLARRKRHILPGFVQCLECSRCVLPTLHSPGDATDLIFPLSLMLQRRLQRDALAREQQRQRDAAASAAPSHAQPKPPRPMNRVHSTLAPTSSGLALSAPTEVQGVDLRQAIAAKQLQRAARRWYVRQLDIVGTDSVKQYYSGSFHVPPSMRSTGLVGLSTTGSTVQSAPVVAPAITPSSGPANTAPSSTDSVNTVDTAPPATTGDAQPSAAASISAPLSDAIEELPVPASVAPRPRNSLSLVPAGDIAISAAVTGDVAGSGRDSHRNPRRSSVSNRAQAVLPSWLSRDAVYGDGAAHVTGSVPLAPSEKSRSIIPGTVPRAPSDKSRSITP